jgi:hypothetical protein
MARREVGVRPRAASGGSGAGRVYRGGGDVDEVVDPSRLPDDERPRLRRYASPARHPAEPALAILAQPLGRA